MVVIIVFNAPESELIFALNEGAAAFSGNFGVTGGVNDGAGGEFAVAAFVADDEFREFGRIFFKSDKV